PSRTGLARRLLRGTGCAARRRTGAGLLRAVLALRDLVAVRAARLAAIAVAEVLDEVVERLLLALSAEQVADRRLRPAHRLLRRAGVVRHLEHVPPELRLHRSRPLALIRLALGVVVDLSL